MHRLKVICLIGFLIFLPFSDSSVAIAGDKEESFLVLRQHMIDEQLKKRGIRDRRVLDAILNVDWHLFVESSLQDLAYSDRPLPIGYGQTISQPYVVAYMTEAAKIRSEDRVLEIGTGSGYQAAVLAKVAKEVYTIEIIEPLARESKKRLQEMGYTNIWTKHGDGYEGWPEKAPFDVIIVTAAPHEIPEKLIQQLHPDGRMVLPIGSFFQDLYRVTKTEKGIHKEKLLPVRFVPMIKSQSE